jgi:hypothetical protein
VRWFVHWKRRGFVCDASATVSDLVSSLPARAAHALWTPLCVAALNTPPARASGQVFLNVLAAAFDGGNDASDLVMPAATLGATLPDAAARWLESRGHAVLRGAGAVVDDVTGDGVRIAAAGGVTSFEGAVVAVGPHQLAGAFSPPMAMHAGIDAAIAATSRLSYESINTIYLGYRGARIAMPPGLLRLDDAPGQWLFERPDVLRDARADAPSLDQLFAVVISTSGPHDTWPQPELARACDEQLRRALARLPALAWSQVIAERRATYACVPGIAHPAPVPLPRLALAGDYVYPRFPATLESAVRSGESAAAAV